jgi:hypothetical protein
LRFTLGEHRFDVAHSLFLGGSYRGRQGHGDTDIVCEG